MILREIKNIYIKNRLTEGVDYKRYEWLDSISGQVTLKINETDFQSLTAYRIGNPNTYFLTTTNPNYGTRYMYFSFESWLPGFVLYNPENINFKINEQNLQFTLTKDGNNIIYKGYSTKSIGYPMNKLVAIVVTKNMVRLKSISTSTGQYLPCKLLQDIPASLSIDNQAYPADTCGLIYTTTGKFIGNSNLTVDGDVEPETHIGLQQIYQNKLIEGVDYELVDWLVGDGSARIDTKHNTNEDLDWETKVILPSNSYLFWYRTDYADNDTVMVGRLTTSFYVGSRVANNTTDIQVGDIGNLEIKYNGINVYVNDVLYSRSPKNIHTDQEFYLFYAYIDRGKDISSYYTSNNVKCSYFRFKSDITLLNLVPCQLLRSIPRNLDAQCKERQAGECGMIDLISGKFYGNVASSGSFTVENDNNE